jgi:hypothetical protein
LGRRAEDAARVTRIGLSGSQKSPPILQEKENAISRTAFIYAADWDSLAERVGFARILLDLTASFAPPRSP